MWCRSRGQILPEFYHCDYCALCTTIAYVTAMYRESVVPYSINYGSFRQKSTMVNIHIEALWRTHIYARDLDHHWNGWLLVTRMFGTKALPEPMVVYCLMNKLPWDSDLIAINVIQGLALLTLSWDKNWDSHSLVNGIHWWMAIPVFILG